MQIQLSATPGIYLHLVRLTLRQWLWYFWTHNPQVRINLKVKRTVFAWLWCLVFLHWVICNIQDTYIQIRRSSKNFACICCYQLGIKHQTPCLHEYEWRMGFQSSRVWKHSLIAFFTHCSVSLPITGKCFQKTKTLLICAIDRLAKITFPCIL